jgi:hypothetical protein
MYVPASDSKGHDTFADTGDWPGLDALVTLTDAIAARPREVFRFDGTLAEFAAALEAAGIVGTRPQYWQTTRMGALTGYHLDGLIVHPFDGLVWAAAHWDDITDGRLGKIPVKVIGRKKGG